MAAGVLPEAELRSVEGHIQSCSECRRAVAELRRELLPGTVVGRYQVLHQVGAGAMGAVYAAHDPKLDRKVALKLLHTCGDQKRLVAEGRAMARLAHPNVVPVLDLGTGDGRVFAAMEFVDGVTLRRWLLDEPSWPEIVAVLLEAGRGLQAAHAAGLTHRDFKPENLLIGSDGRTRVTDFGLARSGTLGGAAVVLPEALATATTSPAGITGTGEIVGTPAYMSPEQFRAQVASAHSDQFSFCVVAWEALYGGRPFDDGSASLQTLAEAVLEGRIREPPASARRIPAPFKRILLRGLSVDPAARHPSMEALLRELAAVGRRRRRVRAAAVALVAAAAVAAGLLGARHREAERCREAGALTEWSTERRAALAASPSVERSLDAWASAFSTMRRQACEATEIEHTQSREVLLLRDQCLEERKAGFVALLEALEKPAVLERAPQAALGRIADCADLHRLVGPAPPRPEVAHEAAELRRRLAALKVQASVGLPVDVSAIVARARALGDRALEAEALVARSQTEDDEQALASARAAVIAAEEARDDRTRARGWLRQAELLQKPQDAARALENARAVLSRVEDAELWARYQAQVTK
jgi:hypothetical protein